jgi:hypothetical protein
VSRPLLLATLASFVVGAAVMIVFEGTIARVLGMTALVGFIVLGLFLVIDPALLDDELDDRD